MKRIIDIVAMPGQVIALALKDIQTNDFELHGRTYKTVICTEPCANPLMEMFPELSVIGVNDLGVHLTQSTDKGLPVDPTQYLKEVYGLDPGDLDLKATDGIDEIERLAKKFRLNRKQDMTLKMAQQILKPFQNK